MRRFTRLFLALGCLAWLLACSGSGDATDATPDSPSVDVPADAPTDVPSDPGSPDGTEPGPDAVDTAAEAVEPPLPAQCAGTFCAASATEAPNPSEYGPFPVGVRTMTFVIPNTFNDDGSPRTLVTEVWYPAVEAARDGQKDAIDLVKMAPDWCKPSFGDAEIPALEIDAYRDAPVRDDLGAFPLIVFSHGAYGIRFQNSFFTIMLASHGYVVVAPDHEKNTLWEIITYGYDSTTLLPSAMLRPKDLTFLMDTFTAKNYDPADDFFGTINGFRIGVTGHSFGGFACFPAARDNQPRVKAIVPLAPAAKMAELYLEMRMTDWSFPTFMMAGEADKTLPYDTMVWNAYKDMQPPKWLVDFPRAGHYSFTDMCRLDLDYVISHMDFPDAEDALKDGCNPTDNVSWQLVHDAVNHYGVAFFNWKLRDSEASKAWLVKDPSLSFDAEMSFFAEPGN